MASIKRNLLILQDQQLEADFHKALTAHNWKIHFARNIDEALDLLTRNKFLVGFCLIEDQHDDKFWQKLRKLCDRSPKINWIMGLSKANLNNISIHSSDNRFFADYCIADYCFDYVLLPAYRYRTSEFFAQPCLRHGRACLWLLPKIYRLP
jgi:hypothetical protein